MVSFFALISRIVNKEATWYATFSLNDPKDSMSERVGRIKTEFNTIAKKKKMSGVNGFGSLNQQQWGKYSTFTAMGLLGW